MWLVLCYLVLGLCIHVFSVSSLLAGCPPITEGPQACTRTLHMTALWAPKRKSEAGRARRSPTGPLTAQSAAKLLSTRGQPGLIGERRGGGKFTEPFHFLASSLLTRMAERGEAVDFRSRLSCSLGYGSAARFVWRSTRF